MSESLFKASQSTTTLLGMYNQFHSLASLPYIVYPETTLNTKYDIVPNAIPTLSPVPITPKIKYFGIGIKGFYNIDDNILAQPYKPKATNMDLHQPIPFRCVPIESDLSASERANYRIRTRITKNGNDYYCYWLKLINFIEQEVRMTQITPSGEEVPYVLDPSNLYPVPTKILTPDILDCDTDRVVVSITGQCKVLGSEVLEAINVLHDGDLRYARVSEFGFYTGEDRSVQGTTATGGSLQYTESVYVQLATHRCTLGTDLSDPTGIHEENIIYESGSMVLL